MCIKCVCNKQDILNHFPLRHHYMCIKCVCNKQDILNHFPLRHEISGYGFYLFHETLSGARQCLGFLTLGGTFFLDLVPYIPTSCTA